MGHACQAEPRGLGRKSEELVQMCPRAEPWLVDCVVWPFASPAYRTWILFELKVPRIHWTCNFKTFSDPHSTAYPGPPVECESEVIWGNETAGCRVTLVQDFKCAFFETTIVEQPERNRLGWGSEDAGVSVVHVTVALPIMSLHRSTLVRPLFWIATASYVRHSFKLRSNSTSFLFFLTHFSRPNCSSTSRAPRRNALL